MFHLRSRVTAEVADAGGALIHRQSQVVGGYSVPQVKVTKVAVLAEEAVVGAGVVEDRKVLVAELGTVPVGILRIASAAPGGADPGGDAVGGKAVVIPGEIPPADGGEQTKPALPVLHHSAESPLSLGDSAGVATASAKYALKRWSDRQSIRLSSTAVSGLYVRLGFIGTLHYTVPAEG